MNTDTNASAMELPPIRIPVQPSQDEPSGLRLDLARALRMRRGLAITVAVVTLLLLVALGVTRKPYYSATSLIYVQPVVSKAATDPSGVYDPGRYDTYIEQQLLTFQRSDILSRALDTMPPAARATFSPDQAAAIKRLDTDLAVTRLPGSYQISVTASGKDPDAVAAIANAVTLTYLANGQQDELALNHQQIDSLVLDRKHIEDELDSDQAEQAKLSTTLGVADTSGDGANPFDATLADLRTQVATARNAHAVAEAQLASGSSRSNMNSAAESSAREDTELAAVKSNLGARRAALLAEMNGLTPANPLYKKDQAELAQLGQAANTFTSQVVRKSSQTVMDHLRSEDSRTREIQSRLEGELASQSAAATSLTPELQRAQGLAESIKLLRARYADVDNAIHSLTLAQNPSYAARLSLVASTPTGPQPSKKYAILALALPIALLFGITAALIRHKLDSRLYIADDLTRGFSLPPMAVLPQPKEVARNVQSEFLFRLVAGLEQAHRLSGASTFVFTTSSQETDIGDIVSAVASQLDSLGYRTMTISSGQALSPDAAQPPNPSYPGQNTELSTTDTPGTTLNVRHEGIIDGHLQHLKQQVDFVLIKALPLRSSAETEFMVRLGDITIVVVQSGRTTRKEFKSCLAIIRRIRTRGIAVVISDLKLRNADEDFIDSVQLSERREQASRPAKPPNEIITIGRI